MIVKQLVLTLTVLFLMPSSEAAETEKRVCTKLADIAFVIDSSSSIWEPYFEMQRNFVRDVVDMFDVRPEMTRIAAVSFSHIVNKEFYFNSYKNKEDVLKAIKNVNYTKGDATRTYKALKTMNKDLFDPKNGARDGVMKIAIVLTDGGTNPGSYDNYTEKYAKSLTQDEARLAKSGGIHMFVIGIGSRVDGAELAGMASDPKSFYLQRVKDFKSLNTASLKQVVAWRTCEVGGSTPPPPAPTAPPTTTPIPQGDQPKKECATKAADVIFVLDESYSILSQDAFQDELDFVIGIVDNFDIGPTKTQVGVIAFSDVARVVFNLNDFNNKKDVKDNVANIRWKGGNTFTDAALRLLMQEGFSAENGARDNVVKIAIIITDGNSTDPYKTKIEAQKVQNKGIKVFAIGVGSAYKQELQTMASKPSVNYVYKVDSLRALKEIKDLLAYSICKEDQKEEPDKECDGKLADIVFIADSSSSIGPRDFEKEMNFISNVSSLFTIGPDFVQLSLITFSTEARTEFKLNEYRSKEEIKKALSTVAYTSGLTYTHKALELMLKESFSKSNGGRKDVPKICIVITDGWSRQPEQTLLFADKAQKSITMFSIGVGEYTVPDELNAMASKPVDEHSFQVTDYNALDGIINSLAERTCKESLRATPVRPIFR